MNILLCGKCTPYLKNLAERLKKEKNEIHYISGSKASDRAGNYVFEQFDFEYTNPNISRIVKGAKPEAMILLGAADRNFSWRNPADDATAFVSGMTALMMAAKGAGVRKIVFISSLSVFEDVKGEVTFDTERQVSSARSDAFIQVENLCNNLRDENTDIRVLRIPEDTGYYDLNTSYDYCALNAWNYLKGEKYLYIPDLSHAAIDYSDATEAVMKVLQLDDSVEKKVFQVQGVLFTEQGYADALTKTELKQGFIPVEDPAGKGNLTGAVVLADSDEKLLQFSPRFELDIIAERNCKACLGYKKQNEKKDRGRMHLLPLIETIVAAAIVTVLTYFLRKTWVGDSFSLFTLYTLLFGAVYGTTYGLFAGLLATVGTLIVSWGDAGLLGTIENYSFFLVFLELILVGVIAGYVRDKYVRKTTTLTEERNYLSQEVTDLTRINDNNIYVKNVYEKRLIGYENSLPRLYELTSQLDYMEPENVIFHATMVTKQLLEVEDVAIYMSSHRSSYYRLSAANTEQATVCGKSIKYDEESFLFAAFEQREIFKNKTMDRSKPSFAGAVMDGDRINAIIMVWTRDLHKINQYESDMLAIVCRLIEKSMSRADLYDMAIRRDCFIEGTRIMKEEVFINRFRNYQEGKSRGVFTYVLLKLIADPNSAVTAQKLIRDTDVLGIIGESLYIILPFSTQADSVHVVNRFKKEGLMVTVHDGDDLERLLELRNNPGREKGAEA